MTTKRGRRLVALAAVAAVAVAVAGCGRGDEPEAVEVVRDMDLLQGAEAAGSARISWEVDVALPFTALDDGGSTGITVRTVQSAEGVVDLSTHVSEWSGTLASEATFPEGSVDEPVPSPTRHFEARTTAAGEWFRTWTDDEEPPPWLAFDEERDDDASDDDHDDHEVEVPDTSLSDPTAFDPTVFFDALREAADSVTVVGEEEVRGDPTTHYRAVVDAGELDAEGSLFPEGEGSVEVDAWVDAEDRLRRVEVGGLRLELWDYGTEVDVAAPGDVADEDDADAFASLGLLPEVTGDWSVASSGPSAAGDWEVWAAPATARGTSTTCRSLELVDSPMADAFGGMADLVEENVPFPYHGGLPAVCGNGTFGVFTDTFVADPALQLLSALPEGDGVLLGVVVRDDLAADGVRLVLDGAEPVELAVDDQGVAVWEASGDDALVAVELDGGAVRCELPAIGGERIEAMAGMLGAMGMGLAPCVRV